MFVHLLITLGRLPLLAMVGIGGDLAANTMGAWMGFGSRGQLQPYRWRPLSRHGTGPRRNTKGGIQAADKSLINRDLKRFISCSVQRLLSNK
jgi:hypothetical protein